MSMQGDTSICTLLHTFSHKSVVKSITWSPNGNTLASGSNNGDIQLWNTQTGALYSTLSHHSGPIKNIAWSPAGDILASSLDDGTVLLWDVENRKVRYTLWSHLGLIGRMAWSPFGHMLASGARDGAIWLLDLKSEETSYISSNRNGPITSVAWSSDGRILAFGSDDSTVQLWDIETKLKMHTLEGYVNPASFLAFSGDGRFLASYSPSPKISYGAVVHIWRTDIWERVAILNTHREEIPLVFHPKKSILAMFGQKTTEVSIWSLDLSTHLNGLLATDTVHYMNAKVVLVGDSGVGKSGLGLVLVGKPFVPTDSTHGRHVWTFDLKEVNLNDTRKELRETLLWDLAGQPSYRLIHQLHLDEVAVALVVFDAKSETDPFSGVQYWNRALKLAQHVQSDIVPPLKKILVAARTDRAGIGVSADRIQLLMRNLDFQDFFETSAKQGRHIPELKAAIEKVIDWKLLPKVSSTHLFQIIKTFLIAEKGSGQCLSTIDNLYHLFLGSKNVPPETKELRAQFETCVRQLESADLVKRLSFGHLILLQPELLDIYASALVNAVKDEPDGLGSITEEVVRTGQFRLPEDERLMDKEQEKLLLIAMVEDLLRRELMLREGPSLIFPSQSTRENPDAFNSQGQSAIFTFEGPVLNIYCTLAVRLAQSGLFRKKEIWKNAVTYTTKVGGIYGISLNNTGEGYAELILFFDTTTSEETRLYFEEYVYTHLQRRALPNSIQQRRILVCSKCGWVVTDQTAQARMKRGFNWLNCAVCDRQLLLFAKEKVSIATLSPLIKEMDRIADSQRDFDAAKSIIEGKKKMNDFDVFLCYDDTDKSVVKQVGEQLKEQGILPWLDEWELRPGLPWQRWLEQQVTQIKTVAVFVGSSGIGPWHQLELEAFLREFVRRGCPVIPVLLEDTPKEPMLPVFLQGMTWVDFRKEDPNPLNQLIWGITGERRLEWRSFKNGG